jgi:hypothetical protein
MTIVTLPMTGQYNFQQWKYVEGLVGMTGGEMRMLKIECFEHDKARTREAIACLGAEDH